MIEGGRPADLAASASRVPGARQGWTLVATTWLAVAAAAVVAPVAPRMAAQFAADPHAEAAVQLGIGLPALFVALLAGVFGAAADRIGRKRLLLGALVLYAICGTAPSWLDSLPLILLSRAGVGVAEAAVLATGTALIGDYFHGERRETWFAIQGGSATLMAIVLISLSGALGETSWRLPFAVYAAPLLLAVLVMRCIWEPARAAPRLASGTGGAPAARLWPGLLPICAVTFLTATAFYVALVQLPFLLVERGFAAPGQVAIGGVACTITAPLGALLFRLMARRGLAVRLGASYAASSAGLLIIAFAPGYWPSLIGAAINGVGSGIALPTLLAWALAGRASAMMGRVAGVWNAAFFFGQFCSPPLFLAVAAWVGGREIAFALFGLALAAGAAAALALALRAVRPAALDTIQAR